MGLLVIHSNTWSHFAVSKQIINIQLNYWYQIEIIEIIEYTFFSLKIINPQNIDKNILENLDQNRINIEVTLLYFINQWTKNTK